MRFILGVIVGILIGVFVIAPNPNVMETAREFWVAAQAWFGEAASGAGEVVERAGEAAEEAARDVGRGVDDAADDVRREVEEGPR